MKDARALTTTSSSRIVAIAIAIIITNSYDPG